MLTPGMHRKFMISLGTIEKDICWKLMLITCHLHDLHNDLPFLPEIIDSRLTPNLNDKHNYVCHIRLLNQVLDHGLILHKVHRVIEFDQIAWMKLYVNFDTSMRMAAPNDLRKISTSSWLTRPLAKLWRELIDIGTLSLK